MRILGTDVELMVGNKEPTEVSVDKISEKWNHVESNTIASSFIMQKSSMLSTVEVRSGDSHRSAKLRRTFRRRSRCSVCA